MTLIVSRVRKTINISCSPGVTFYKHLHLFDKKLPFLMLNLITSEQDFLVL